MLTAVEQALSCSVHGSPSSVRTQLARLLSQYIPDEVLFNGQIHDRDARLRSFEIVADAMRALGPARATHE